MGYFGVMCGVNVGKCFLFVWISVCGRLMWIWCVVCMCGGLLWCYVFGLVCC